MASGQQMRSIATAHRDAAAVELRQIMPELDRLKRRLSDKARYLVSVVEPRLDAISHPLLTAAVALDDTLTRERSDRLKASVDAAEVSLTKVVELEKSLAEGRSVDGQVLRRYLTLMNKISEAGASLAREAASASRARQSSSSFHGERAVELAGERLSGLESEIAQIVEAHGSDLVERASSLAAMGRELAAARAEHCKTSGRASKQTEALETWTVGRRARLVQAVVYGMMSDLAAASTVFSHDGPANENVRRFLSANPDLSEQLSRGEILAEQAAKAISRKQVSQSAIRALDQSNWSQHCGRFAGLDDDQAAALANAFDESAMIRVRDFCDAHFIPSAYLAQRGLRGSPELIRYGGSIAINRP